MLTLFATALVLFVLFTLVFLPVGELLFGLVLGEDSDKELRFLGAFAFSLLFLGVVLSAGIALHLPHPVVRWGLLAILMFSLWLWLLLGRFRVFLSKGVLELVLLWLVYFFFTVLTSAYPRGSIIDVSAASIQALTGLPIDNIIPYNVARYIVEGISPSLLEVVPTWSAFERGPLAGLATAVILILFDLKEHEHWLSTSPNVFFVYQVLLVYLNLLVIPAVWFIATRFFSRREAVCALLLLFSSYFFLLNSVFVWPKLLMCYFLLTGLLLWSEPLSVRKKACLTGLFFAGAMLAHDSALFPILAFFAIQVLKFVFAKPSLRAAGLASTAAVFASSLFFVAPWQLYKAEFGTSSRRLLYLHLFCNTDLELEQVTLFSALFRYLRDNSLWKILSLKLANLFYPFDVMHPLPALSGHWQEPYALATALSPLVVYQLIFAVGLPTFLLFLVFFFDTRQSKQSEHFLPFVFVTYGALVFAVALFGCPLSTWNHQWGTPAFVLTMIPCAAATWIGKTRIRFLLFALSVAWNVLFLVLGLWFKPERTLYLHATPQFLFAQLLLFVLLFILGFAFIWTSAREDDEEV